jgi:hypothetical protein
MRRRGAILIATAFLALTVFAGPASAVNAKNAIKGKPRVKRSSAALRGPIRRKKRRSA